jgi:hypothetical protein
MRVFVVSCLLLNSALAFVLHSRPTFARLARPVRSSSTQTIAHIRSCHLTESNKPLMQFNTLLPQASPLVLSTLAAAAAAIPMLSLDASASIDTLTLLITNNPCFDTIANNAQACTDLSHLVLDLCMPTRWPAKMAAIVVGRLLNLRADYLPDANIATEEIVFQAGMMVSGLVYQLRNKDAAEASPVKQTKQ